MLVLLVSAKGFETACMRNWCCQGFGTMVWQGG